VADARRGAVFELAGHFDIAIGLTRMLIAGREDVKAARDRTGFFINPRWETGPVLRRLRHGRGEDPRLTCRRCWLRPSPNTTADARAIPASLVDPATSRPSGWMSSSSGA
jgi:hypothetical protein